MNYIHLDHGNAAPLAEPLEAIQKTSPLTLSANDNLRHLENVQEGLH